MPSTKVKVILDIEYDLPPTKYNKTEIEKILAISCHLLQRDNLLSWADIEVKNYRYKIDTNPRFGSYNKNYNRNKQNQDTKNHTKKPYIKKEGKTS